MLALSEDLADLWSQLCCLASCLSFKIATQPRVMKNRSMPFTAQHWVYLSSLCSSIHLDLTGNACGVSPYLELLHSCLLSVLVHIRCSFCNFLDFPIIILSFSLTPSCEVNLETLDDSKFKG